MKAWIVALFVHGRVAHEWNTQSVQKLRTAVSIMMLYEQGRLTFILVENFIMYFVSFITIFKYIYYLFV